MVQTRSKGGTTVYDARAIVWGYNPGVIFNEEDYCNDGAYFKMTETKNSSLNLIYLIPNPAKDKITLYYKSDNKSVANFSILDATGRVISQQKLDTKSDSHEIELGNFVTGIYTFKIIADESQVANLKLCIFK